jgi:choline dehydrogenase-like flavoprotein
MRTLTFTLAFLKMRTHEPVCDGSFFILFFFLMLMCGIVPLYNAMAKMPGMDIPLDCNQGDNGLCWYPSSIDPVNFARSYAKTGHYDEIVNKRENFHVIGGSRVNKIILKDDVATGVQFVPSTKAGDPTVVKAKVEVILAAGTIHTPQVLQLSGIGPKKLLHEANIPVVIDLPGVGQKFTDQAYVPSVTFACKCRLTRKYGLRAED